MPLYSTYMISWLHVWKITKSLSILKQQNIVMFNNRISQLPWFSLQCHNNDCDCCVTIVMDTVQIPLFSLKHIWCNDLTWSMILFFSWQPLKCHHLHGNHYDVTISVTIIKMLHMSWKLLYYWPVCHNSHEHFMVFILTIMMLPLLLQHYDVENYTSYVINTLKNTITVSNSCHSNHCDLTIVIVTLVISLFIINKCLNRH